FWTHLFSFKWMESWSDWKGSRDWSGERAIEKIYPVAYRKLGDHAKRREILKLMAEQRYEGEGGVYDKLAKLDSESADKAWEKYLDSKPKEYRFHKLDLESSLTRDSADPRVVKAMGVLTSQMNYLDRYMLGFMMGTTIYDIGFMSAVSVGVGWAIRGASKGIPIAVRWLQGRPLIGALKPGALFPFRYPKRLGLAWNNNFTNTLELRDVVTLKGLAKQAVTTNLLNALRFNAGQAVVMSVASTGMGAVHYWVNPDASGTKDFGEFLKHSAIGGASFGPKAGLLFLMSPFPATAFGNSALGRGLRNVAQGAGPVSGLANVIARASLRLRRTEAGKKGLFEAAEEATNRLAPVPRAAAKVGLRTAGFVDGAGKYFVLGEGMMDAAALAHYYGSAKAEELGLVDPYQDMNGITGRLQRLSGSVSTWMRAGQVSWLLIPVNTMSGRSEMAQARETERAYYTLSRQKQLHKLETASNSDPVQFKKKWYSRGWGERFKRWLRKGEGEVGEIQGQEDLREMANRERARGMSDLEIMVGATVDASAISGRRKLKELIALADDGAQGGLSLDVEIADAPAPRKKSAGETSRRPGRAADDRQAELFGGSSASPRPEPPALAADEVFVTPEAVKAWRETLIDRLLKKADLREKIINAEDSLHWEEGGQTYLISGKALKRLKTEAQWAEINSAPLPLGAALSSLIKTRFWQALIDLPSETPSEMMITGVRQHIESMAKRKARNSPEENLREARQQVQAIRRRSAAEDARSLDGLVERLAEPSPVSEKIARAKAEIDRLIEQDRGAPRKTLEGLKESLDGRLSAGDLIHYANLKLDDLIEQAGSHPTYRKSLESLRRTIESDADLQFVNINLVKEIDLFRQASRGPQEMQRLERAIELLIDVWEQGVFGLHFRVRVERGGELVWEIPEEYRFSDVNQNSIKAFRRQKTDAEGRKIGPKAQLEIIRENFLSVAGALPEKGADGKEIYQPYNRLYDLLETSGGKTLLGFVLIGMMEAYAKVRGKEGAIYATANGDLVLQTLDNYKAFFRGRQPKFQVMTYSDLMLRQTMAQASGTLTPFQTHEVYADEFDIVGLGTPLSLGQFNGKLSFPDVDPFQRALREGVEEAWTVLHQRHGGQSLSQAEFRAMLESDANFRLAFNNLVARTLEKANEAHGKIRSGEVFSEISEEKARQYGMTRDQLYAQMLKEYRNALGSAFKLGVVEARYGKLENWIRKILEGAYESASEGARLHSTYEPDPDPRRSIISYVNDLPLDNLDTFNRTPIELRERKPLTLDFEHMAITDMRKLNEAARDADALLIAASGTLPDSMRPFFRQEMGYRILGEGTNPGKAMKQPHVLLDGAGADSTRVQIQWSIAHWRALKERVERVGERSGRQARRVPGFLWLSSKPELEPALETMAESGVRRERVAILTMPGSNYFERERYMFEVELMRNMKAAERGEIDFVLIVGQMVRGLEPPLTAKVGGKEDGPEVYKGAIISMYITNSQKLSDVSLLQLMGRIDRGRIPSSAKTRFYLLDEKAEILGQKAYWTQMRHRVRQSADEGYKASWKNFEEAIRPHLKPGENLDEATILRRLQEPELIDAKRFYRDYLTRKKLHDLVGRDRLGEARANEVVMKEIMSDPKVIQVLTAEMRRVAEEDAIKASGILP
ncbi:MAG: hypothetical protein HY549_09600, partial [Elusimicrobia bacterium]|nr:hypothetical protein [Elusimicrobiota bacterium]